MVAGQHLDGFLQFIAERSDDIEGVVQEKRALFITVVSSQFNSQRLHLFHTRFQFMHRPLGFLYSSDILTGLKCLGVISLVI